MKKIKNNQGLFLIEILIGAAIISVGILVIITSYVAYIQYAFSNERNVEANYLLEEGIEAVTFLRDDSWGNISGLSTSTTYYLVFGGTVSTTTVPQYVDGVYLRSFTVSDVYRDVNDDIAPTGMYDPDTVKITSIVEYWQGHSTTTKSLSTYISDIYSN